MRHTPFLDKHGIEFKDEVPDSIASIIDNALGWIEGTIDWGEYEGRKRKPCPEQPMLLAGQPIGMYHCPDCGCMLIAGMPHIPPDGVDGNPETDKYELITGREWPAGYEKEDQER
jgi:hypothetical protein